MDVLDQVRIIVYRFHEKGLEILLVNHEMNKDPNIWELPGGAPEKKLVTAALAPNDQVIELDAYQDQQGRMIKTYAIEGDWHDIPSIRGMIKYDIKLIKSKIKQVLPEFEQGSYFGIKEAFRKVMPNEYRVLKELKDILCDRNVVRNI